MLSNNGTYRVYTLDDGLRIAIDKTPTKTISGTYTVHFGAIYEKPGEEGLAHFLEHSLFDAGTRKYSPSETDQILEKFGKINAETKIDSTISPVKMLSKHLEAYLDLISEAFFYPRFEESRVERERTAILNEIADQKSNPSYKNSLLFYEALFGKGHPLNYLIGGKEDVVSEASIEDLKKFHSRGYFANNSDLILCGGVPKNIDELIQQYFADKQMGNVQSFVFPQPKPLTERQVIHFHEPSLHNIDKPDQSRAQVSIGLLVPSETSDKCYPAIMLDMILGGHPYSRLMQTTRYESGLAYHIKSEYHGDFNTGYVQISTGVPSKKVDEAVDAIFSAFQKLQLELVKDEELEKRKQAIEFEIEYGMESNEGRAAVIERDLKLATRLEERVNKLNGVTPQEIRDAALKYLPRSKEDSNFVMMISDPLKKE